MNFLSGMKGVFGAYFLLQVLANGLGDRPIHLLVTVSAHRQMLIA